MDTNENTKPDTLTCVICEHKIEPHPISGWAFGHEAYPVAKGRCCDYCNSTDVLPARMFAIRGKEWVNGK